MVQPEEKNNSVYDDTCNKESSACEDKSSKTTPSDSLSTHELCSLNEEQRKVDTEVSKAPDGGWGWFVVLGCFLVHFIIGGFERSNGIMYLQLLSRYKRSATATAWVLSIFSTLRLILGPLASLLCNRFSSRFAVMLGAGISVIGVLTSGFVPDVPYMYLTYGVLCGIGRALVYTPSVVAVGTYFNKRRGIAVGVSTSGVGFGGFVFPTTIELLFSYYGFPWTFVILSAVISNFFVCGALFRPLELQWRLMKQKKRNGEGIIHAEDAKHFLISKPSDPSNEKIESKRLPLFKRKMSQVKLFFKGKQTSEDRKPLLQLSLFKNFAFCALCMQLFLFTLSMNITSLFLPALAKERGVSGLEGAYLVSIVGICDGFSRIINSTLLDLKRVKPFRLLIINVLMFLVAIVSVMLPYVTTFWQFAIVSGLYGMLSGTYMSQKSVVVVDVLGVSSLSSAFGFLMLAQGISSLIGSTVGGMFKDFLGSYDMAFYFGSTGIVLGGLMMAAGNFWLHKKRKEMQGEEMKK